MEKLCMVASCVDIDEVRYPGKPEVKALGGAGLYAYAGMRVFGNSSYLACHMPKRCIELFGEWFESNQVCMDCVDFVDNGSMTRVDYRTDETRRDLPVIGLAGKRALNPGIDDIRRYLAEETRGIYVFRHLDIPFLEDLSRLRKEKGLLVMWEIAADSALPCNREAIADIAASLGGFSINMKEASSLFDTTDEDELKSELSGFGDAFVYLRDGSRGAWLIHAGEMVFCPSADVERVVDTTGCGNSSTGAVLQSLCCGAQLLEAASQGAAAAARILGQYGPPTAF